jgi:hypothetical protein
LQALDLGLWLRRRYIDGLNFLPASYQQGEQPNAAHYHVHKAMQGSTVEKLLQSTMVHKVTQ